MKKNSFESLTGLDFKRVFKSEYYWEKFTLFNSVLYEKVTVVKYEKNILWQTVNLI